jgi:hypothetical protein
MKELSKPGFIPASEDLFQRWDENFAVGGGRPVDNRDSRFEQARRV